MPIFVYRDQESTIIGNSCALDVLFIFKRQGGSCLVHQVENGDAITNGADDAVAIWSEEKATIGIGITTHFC